MLAALLLALVALSLGDAGGSGTGSGSGSVWRCPAVGRAPLVSCSCDLPHTLRCTGDRSALRVVARALRGLRPPAAVSLLDCTLQGVATLDETVLDGVLLHGLVVSSGELRRVSERAFAGLAGPLQALGLPNNALEAVPGAALATLPLLQRLDLSHNKLRSLDGASFKGLFNLTFLDMSENQLSSLQPDTFSGLPALQTLRLRNNRLSAATPLLGLQALLELDLAGNALDGPLEATALPRLPALRLLQLAGNQLSSVRRDALAGLPALVALSLHHNQIDVLEDDAFRQLASLQSLDLAHNRIVAVSGASLAHLARLSSLDLAHNFLRALTADLVAPLRSLAELRLDDNDISMVAGDALTAHTRLRRLTLTDNPLNCDCSLADFAAWLKNATSLPAADQASAICATPPSLENGVLTEVAPEELVCGEDTDLLRPDAGPGAGPPLAVQLPESEAKATLQTFAYDGLTVSLLWSVRADAVPYTCNSVIVYEERGAHEVLLENVRLQCNSSQLADPRSLSVPLTGLDLEPGRNYRYCLLLLEGGGTFSDELRLEWGCSDIVPLVAGRLSPTAAPAPAPAAVTGLRADLGAAGAGKLAVATQLWRPPPHAADCVYSVAVFREGALQRKELLNCSQPRAVFQGLFRGPYEVCAALGDARKCVLVREPEARQEAAAGKVVVAVVAILLALVFVLLLYCASRLLLRRPPVVAGHQYFLASPQDDEQHSHYVKLQATTKL